MGIDEPEASKLLAEERDARRGSGLFIVPGPDQPLKITFQRVVSFWRLTCKKKSDERRMREARDRIRVATDPEEQFLRSTETGDIPTAFSPPNLRQTVSEEAIPTGSWEIPKTWEIPNSALQKTWEIPNSALQKTWEIPNSALQKTKVLGHFPLPLPHPMTMTMTYGLEMGLRLRRRNPISQ